MGKIEKSKQNAKKRSKKYKAHMYTPKSSALQINMRGFLCCCGNYPNEGTREAFNILHMYAEQRWPLGEHNVSTNESEKTIEEALSEELSSLKVASRFKSIDTGSKNFAFISTSVDEPVQFVEYILKDLALTKQANCRYLQRLLPIEAVCKAYEADIVKAFVPLCNRLIGSAETQKFSIYYNHHFNDSIDRVSLIAKLAQQITTTNGWKVDLKNPDYVAIVEVIKAFALISIVPHFFKYKKYNLIKICEPVDQPPPLCITNV